jgi:hypothetical protein
VNIAVGVALDPLGMARQWQPVASRTYGRTFDAKLVHWANPTSEVRETQPPKIKVNWDHTHEIVGTVAHLEKTRGQHLWAVCELYGDEVDPARLPELYYSVETDFRRDFTDVVITGIGLVEQSAQTGITPVKIIPGELRNANRHRTLERFEKEILEHAADAVRHRPAGAPIHVRDQQVELELERFNQRRLHPDAIPQLIELELERLNRTRLRPRIEHSAPYKGVLRVS